MALPIYKVFMDRRSEAWFQLSKEEQDGFEAKLNEALEKVGAKRLIVCNSSWSSDPREEFHDRLLDRSLDFLGQFQLF